MSKPIASRVDDHSRHGAVLDSRVSVLEHQLASIRSQSDLEFAIQQELNDWNENLAMEKFIVLTGLPPAPQKLSGGIICCFPKFFVHFNSIIV